MHAWHEPGGVCTPSLSTAWTPTPSQGLAATGAQLHSPSGATQVKQDSALSQVCTLCRKMQHAHASRCDHNSNSLPVCAPQVLPIQQVPHDITGEALGSISHIKGLCRPVLGHDISNTLAQLQRKWHDLYINPHTPMYIIDIDAAASPALVCYCPTHACVCMWVAALLRSSTPTLKHTAPVVALLLEVKTTRLAREFTHQSVTHVQ